MPEEINRIVADRFSELLFLHSDEAIATCARRHRRRADALRRQHDDRQPGRARGAIPAAGTAARLGVEPGAYALVTLHRPALVDGPLLPRSAHSADLAREMPVVFPVHPRTRKMMESASPSTRACS